MEIDLVEEQNASREPVPVWVADEIRKTWNAARAAGGELQAFRIIERMVDRLGYGRVENNPPMLIG